MAGDGDAPAAVYSKLKSSEIKLTALAFVPADPSDPSAPDIPCFDLFNVWYFFIVVVFSTFIVYSTITKSVDITLWFANVTLLADISCAPTVIVPVVTEVVTLNSLSPGVASWATLLYSVAPSNTTISVPDPAKLDTTPFALDGKECELLDSIIVKPLDPALIGAMFIVSKALSTWSPSETPTLKAIAFPKPANVDGEVIVAVSWFWAEPSVNVVSSAKCDPAPVNLKKPSAKAVELPVNVIVDGSGLLPSESYLTTNALELNLTTLASAPEEPLLPVIWLKVKALIALASVMSIWAAPWYIA